MNSDDLAQLAEEAYVYGYPLVADLTGATAIVETGFGPMKPAPLNTFSHAVGLADPEAKFVTVNNDTIYVISTVDVSAGPLVLHVPDTDDRYYVLQFVDAWSNNFAYVGRRATGTAEGEYLLAPSGWEGDAPQGMPRIDSPTRVFNIIGRVAVDGEADLAAAKELQQHFTLRPLEGGAEPSGIPRSDSGLPEHLGFFESMRLWMREFPPPQAEAKSIERFEPIGLLAAESTYAGLDDATSAALAKGLVAGKDKIEGLSKGDAKASGWTTTPHMFDYNLDHLELGTIDEPKWKIADRQEAIVTRAVAARVGLWGNHAYEALYAFSYNDSGGEQLIGSRSYEMRLAGPLPVEAFWSLTMYDMPDYYLVANPIERYSIGDRTPGLDYADDGSLTIYIQHEKPSEEAKLANWLPAPAGDFRPALRMYQPEDALLDGSYELPAIERVQ